jgi:hypothetical protein
MNSTSSETFAKALTFLLPALTVVTAIVMLAFAG